MQYTEDNRLCPDHKEYYRLPKADTAKRTEDLADDEEIDCDACACAALRALGAI